jgi:hypothetical protein
VNRLAVQRESALESEETVGVERDWVRCVISEWGLKESEDVKPVESGQDETSRLGALCIKNVGWWWREGRSEGVGRWGSWVERGAWSERQVRAQVPSVADPWQRFASSALPKARPTWSQRTAWPSARLPLCGTVCHGRLNSSAGAVIHRRRPSPIAHQAYRPSRSRTCCRPAALMRPVSLAPWQAAPLPCRGLPPVACRLSPLPAGKPLCLGCFFVVPWQT